MVDFWSKMFFMLINYKKENFFRLRVSRVVLAIIIVFALDQ